MNSEPPPKLIVEREQPLELSVLWTWMKEFYQEGGTSVWSDGEIPFHITNTPLLAQGWIDSILSFLRDFLRLGLLDFESPITVVELGPGTGRHAFFLLQALQRLEKLTRALTPEGLEFRLHLAELGEKGLATLSAHPQFQSYLSEGKLVLSRFDVQTDKAPRVWPDLTDELYSKPSPNPVFVITNYVLDSLPYDLIRINGRLTQRADVQVAIDGLEEGREVRDVPDLGERISIQFSYPNKGLIYRNAHWRNILESYQQLKEETHIPFPTCALRLAERIRTWSKSAAVLLVADKSFTHLEQFQELEEPELVPHGGGFSFNANVHALGLYAKELGGYARHSSCRDGTLDLSHIVFPRSRGAADLQDQLWEVEYRLDEVERFHAIDRFRLKESIDEFVTNPNLRLSLDILRLSGFDPQVFYELSDHILNGLESDTLEEETRAEVRNSLPLVLERIFPVGDDTDAAFEVGRVAYRLELYEVAQQAFEMSLEQYGPDARAHFNIGLGWYYRRNWGLAESAFEQALLCDPEYREAGTWIKKTRRKMVLK